MKAQDFKIFMRQADLDLATKGLWALILTWADKDGTNAYPTIQTLSEISGETEQWIKRHLRVMRDKGYVWITKDRKKGARHSHNVYALKCRCHQGTPYGYHGCTTTKSLYQKSDSLAVESEAILRVVPKDKIEEDKGNYGMQA